MCRLLRENPVCPGCGHYEGCSSFEAAQKFCRIMCTDSLLPPYLVYSSNGWCYAYGHSFEKEILEDARVISELTEGLKNRPFMVVDSCWQRQFWERTRRMGVTLLAFHLPEDGAFYAADADCVGIMNPVSWDMNHQWAHLLAHSGTPFFTSIKPGILTEAEKERLQKDFRLAIRQEARAIPLDWMANTAPRQEGRNIIIFPVSGFGC